VAKNTKIPANTANAIFLELPVSPMRWRIASPNREPEAKHSITFSDLIEALLLPVFMNKGRNWSNKTGIILTTNVAAIGIQTIFTIPYSPKMAKLIWFP